MAAHRLSSVTFCVCVFVVIFSAVTEGTFLHMIQIAPMKQAPMKQPACKPNCCKSVQCLHPKCHPGQKMKPQAGWCGCCPKCMTQLKEGSPCQPKPKHPCPNMPSAECGCGLKCMHGKCCKH